MLRRQLPAWSPVSLNAVLGAARGTLAPSVVADLERLVRAEYTPAMLRLTDSGTSALALAMRLAGSPGVKPRIALPAWSCYDLATAADTADADVVLYDVDPVTLGPDWASFEAAMEHRPGAVVVVHAFGFPVDMDLAGSRAAAAGALLIEDAAQAVGAEFQGRPAGTMAPVAVLSFGRGKGRTGGGGGALLVFERGLERYLSALPLGHPSGSVRTAALLGAQWLLGRPLLYGVLAAIPGIGLGQTVYRAPRPVRHVNGASAAALLATWSAAGQETAVRRATAARLAARLDEHPGLGAITPHPSATPGYLRLPVVSRAEPTPFSTLEAGRLGVIHGYPTALCDLAGFERRIGNRGDPFPGARLLARRLGTLPTHSRLTPRDLAHLESWLDRLA